MNTVKLRNVRFLGKWTKKYQKLPEIQPTKTEIWIRKYRQKYRTKVVWELQITKKWIIAMTVKRKSV